MRLAAYYRVSTKSQGDDDRLGLPSQREAIDSFCLENGHEVVREFVDIGYSGARADRPALAELLQADGFDGVVVAKWDRLARDVRLDGYLRYELQRRNLTILSASEANGIDAMSVLVQGILASVAGYERHLISQRLAGARKIKAARGLYAHGQAPYGTRAAGGKLEINQNEFEILQIIVRYRADGRTMRAIAEALNADGHPTRQGKQWGPSSVHGALSSFERVQKVIDISQHLENQI